MNAELQAKVQLLPFFKSLEWFGRSAVGNSVDHDFLKPYYLASILQHVSHLVRIGAKVITVDSHYLEFQGTL